ncbi:zinc ribbon domain-containing protein YjdM [Thermonema rossianum]|jgi:protein PhnA|uniref:zinc ribbon domain-containing protein YjdM n=1 Tax=Thermonema rossianum TaxID=55505 RepID=UPI00057063D7|nr:zinc ribbon domain-containing protein YjdM [Thermonema rossianum]
MSENSIPPCPACHSIYAYFLNDSLCACPECGHEWSPSAEQAAEKEATRVLDANGNELHDGDTVIVVKDLPVKGAPKAIKAGTKVKNIRLTEGEHNIHCKIDGFGAMGLKSEFVRKA